MKSSVVLLLCSLVLDKAHGLTRSISFPLKSTLNVENDAEQLKTAFQDVVHSTDFFVQTSRLQKEKNCCSVPLFGDSVQVKLRSKPVTIDCTGSQPGFILSVEDTGEEEFGWICAKFYENKALFHDIIDTSDLQAAVIDHFDKQPAHPGFKANSAKLAGSRQIENLFHEKKNAMLELEANGFIVLNNGPKATRQGNEELTKFLVEKTNQSEHVRTDTVHFLNRQEAKQCGFQEHFDTLMGIASFLNDNINLRDSVHKAKDPATEMHPLTIPGNIQLAEYGENDFYKAHSDNSLTDKFEDHGARARSNFRHYTCILYCNDNWNKEDGGVLRLYPNTRNVISADDAVHQGYDYVDVSPQNGRLIIFDSCLIHSVEKVTHETKKRRALTLWINRPDNSGVEGEKYF